MLLAGALLLIWIVRAAEYSEDLRVSANGVVRLQFVLHPKHLPIPLRSAMAEHSTSVSIKYGPYFHEHSKSPNPSSTNTISTDIITQNPINLQLKQILEAVFLISISQRYSYQYRYPSSFWFNDPNDKFCTHHIEQILRNFLPCATNSGLAQLIDLERFFGIHVHGKQRYGMHISWTKDQFRCVLYTEVQALKKIKVNEKCLSGSQLYMQDAEGREIGLKELVVQRLEESLKNKQPKQQVQKLLVHQEMFENWYHPEKQLRISVESTQKIENNSQIIISLKMPHRAGLQSAQLHNLNPSMLGTVTLVPTCKKSGNPQQPRYKQASMDCTLFLTLHTHIESKADLNLLVLVRIRSRLMCFDLYQTSFGGGYELPLFPVLLIQGRQGEVVGVEEKVGYYGGNVSLRMPEPDESLPFQVITFVLAVYGYLWLSVWRKFTSSFKDIQNRNKAPENEKTSI